ncbi:MAG: SH3 domain-containing protein [Chloroflexota bacterium]
MTVVRDRRPARRARELLVAAWGAALLLLALTLPVAGAPPGPTKLLDPVVSPRATDAATPVTFTITYRNAHALPPDYVRVAVGEQRYAMAGNGSDWKAGVEFTVTTTLPAGTHDVLFEARDAERFVDELAAGSVTIGPAPSPDPTPTLPPTPTPPPTSTPEPSEPPDATPGPGTSGGGSAGGGTTGGGTSGGTAGGSTGGTDGGSSSSGSGTGAGTIDANGSDDLRGSGRGPDGMALDESTAAGAPGGTGSGEGSSSGTSIDDLHHRPWFAIDLGWSSGAEGSVTSGGPGGSGGASAGGTGTGNGTGDSTGVETGGDSLGGSAAGPGNAGGSGDPMTWLQASLNGGLAALGLSGTGAGQLPTIPAVVTSSVLVTTWMAFMIFNKRRRDGEPPAPDGVLQSAAATGIGMGMVFAPAPVAPPDPEALMPRWRRPSLLEARKTDPVRSPAPERPRLTFEIGAPGSAGAATGAERRTIRYAVIPLLDRPDEILATRIGELVAGDEVQVEQRSGAYCRVLCPDGRQGWVHRTTLGDVIARPDNGNGRVEPEPEADNALAAMLAARGLR